MKTSMSDYRFVTSRERKRARLIFLVLISIAALISIYQGSLAQSGKPRGSFASLQNEGFLTGPHAGAASTRRVFVRSTSLLVRGAVVEEKLLKRPEFQQLGFAITRDESDAHLILELRHDLLTKYVFSVVDVKTRTLLAGGKLSSLGGTVAGKVAKRFVKEMARMPAP
jgi:hypothetical protein